MVNKILKNIVVAIFLFIPLFCIAGAIPFHGSYQMIDGSTASLCSRENIQTGECSCIGSANPAYQFRMVHDLSGAIGGGDVKICSANSVNNSEFFGAFQRNDSGTCSVVNSTTGGCSCPAGTTTLALRIITDTEGGLGGAYLNLCMAISSTPKFFGGAYQVDDSATCLASNPDTGACSCPSGFNPQNWRAIVDVGSYFHGSSINSCVPQNTFVEICKVNGVSITADISGISSASDSIQACLEHAPSENGLVTINLPEGKFLIDKKLTIGRSLTLTSSGSLGSTQKCLNQQSCATLFASPQLFDELGLIVADGVNNPAKDNIWIDHIIIDGNRKNRLGDNPAYQKCIGKFGVPTNIYGYNATISSDKFKLTNSVSMNALCGTGFGYNGNMALIDSNLFLNNGNNNESSGWSDGLTIGFAHDSVISNNSFIDNSDVALIVGGGMNTKIFNNVINQNIMPAFAAFMLNSFDYPGSVDNRGDFTDALISNNIINCQVNKCFFGINIGDHAWSFGQAQRVSNIVGGTLSGNNITGGIIGLNIDGAGVDIDSTHPKGKFTIVNNTFNGPSTIPNVSCSYPIINNKTITSARLSISSDSKVVSDMAPDVIQDVHRCNGSLNL